MNKKRQQLLQKIDYEKVSETYVWVKDYKNPKLLPQFIDNLKAFSSDSRFLSVIGIKYLDEEDLSFIQKNLLSIARRRGFLGLLAGAATITSTLSSKSDNKPEEYRNARELFNQILKISKLTPAIMPVASKNPYTPTIIIIEDIHGGKDEKTGWKIEFERLELLRKNFGFNFVGLEGWAGQLADLRRGKRILNGEDMLIRKLMDDSNYSIIGLEDPELQIKALEHSLIFYYKYVFELYHPIYEYVKSYQITKKSIDEVMLSLINQAGELLELKINSNEAADMLKKEIDDTLSRLGIKENKQKLTEILSKLPELNEGQTELSRLLIDFAKVVRVIFVDLSELYNIRIFDTLSFFKMDNYLKTKYSNIYRFRFKDINNSPEVKNVTYALREKFAITKMIEAIKKLRKTVGIMVFGKGHTQGLLKEFINQAGEEINIIISQEPSERGLNNF